MMKLTCILIALAVVGTYADEPEKMVNGIPTSIEEYPHAISMRINGNHMCGGSIISQNTIVTAAHCLAPLESNGQMKRAVRIFTGTTYLNQGGESFGISRLYIHENYDRNAPGRAAGYDIGLIVLDRPIPFNGRQQPIALPTRDIPGGEGVTIVAWGATGFRKGVHNNLQKLNAQSMLASTCQQYHQNFMRIHHLEFCTLINHGTGTCNGDSGSGVVRNADRTIIGLVSGGRPCAVGYPDVYTNVSPFVGWIRQRMV